MPALLSNLLHFGRLLHQLGLDVPAGRMRDVAEALAFIDLGRRTEFYHTLRTLLVHRAQDLDLFDDAFGVFWRQPHRDWVETDLRAMGETRRSGAPEFESEIPSGNYPNTLQREPTYQVERMAALSYSQHEGLWVKDFEHFTAEEITAAQRMMANLDWQLGNRASKRWTTGRGTALDLRRVIRANIRFGGEFFELPTRKRKTKKRPLILVCDVSGSMERYSRMLLHFIHSLTDSGCLGHVESFVFATRLTRITLQLADRSIGDVVPTLSRTISDFGGGTRIGEALRTFNVNWARRLRSQGPTTLLISDGWDRGDPILLGAEMARLQRSCHRLIWLNPLLGSPDYLPLTRGMQAALPSIDDFLPVHNLQSLEALAQHLNTLPTNRPTRRHTFVPTL